MLAPTFISPVPSDPRIDTLSSYSPSEVPSSGGHGTQEILEVTRYLETHGVECCIVSVSALIFYGAARTRDEWDLCVPDDKLNEAVSLLTSEYMHSKIQTEPPNPIPQPSSLSHTYHRFKGVGIHLYFVLVPAHDAHIPSNPFQIQRSLNGIPYPTLSVLMQSFLDTNDDVALCDCIDGTDVSEEWGLHNLKLDGTNDLEWTKRMNCRATDAARGKGWLFTHYFPTSAIDRREKWVSRVRNKKARLGWTTPEEVFNTRFRLKGSPDPWTQQRISC